MEKEEKDEQSRVSCLRREATQNDEKDQTRKDEVRRVSSFRRAVPQILASLAKNTLSINLGICLGYLTIVLPALKNEFKVTKEQTSWFSSVSFICVPIGCLTSGYLIQRFGRKGPMLTLCIPWIASWLLYARASNIWFLYAAAALQGLITGLLEAPVNTYVAEICEPNLRGCLSITTPLTVVIGVFLQFFIANYLTWRDCAYVNISFPVTSIICISLIPESPYWLIGRGHMERAGKSLMWLRGWTTLSAVRAELDDLVLYIQEDSNNRSFNWKTIKNTNFLKPFFLVTMTFAIGHFSGMATIQTFSIEIFEYLHSPVESYKAVAIEGFLQLAATLLCLCIIPFIKRRHLTLVCSIASGICLSSLGVFHQGWPAFILLLVSIFLLNMCARVMPWVLIGEVFPPDSRSVASGLSSSAAYLINFLAHKTFANIVDLVSLKGLLIFYGVVSLFGTVFYYFFLPETEGKTLQEIQTHFKNPNYDRNINNPEEERDSFIEGIM